MYSPCIQSLLAKFTQYTIIIIIIVVLCEASFGHHWYSATVAIKDKNPDQDDTSDEEETAQEKKIRLAKEYIAELEEQGK